MLLLDGEDPLEHSPRGWIVVAEVSDHLTIAVDGDALRDEIFLDHVRERFAFDVLGVTAHQQSLGIEIRFALELNYSLRDLIGMTLFVVSVF